MEKFDHKAGGLGDWHSWLGMQFHLLGETALVSLDLAVHQESQSGLQISPT